MNYINIFNIAIPSYSVLILIGLIVANILSLLIVKKFNLSFDNFILIETYSIFFGIIGAKLLYLLTIINKIDITKLFNWNYVKPLIEGGFVFYGGLIFGLLGLYLVKIIHKIDVINYLSHLVFFIPLVHGFGRIGCYLAGCCYGIPYDGIFCVEYHNIPYTLCNTKLFPIQLVEAFLLFILSAILFCCVLKNKASINLILYYLISYSIIRFILEFYRYDAARGHLWIFSTSQWISILILILTLIKLKNINHASLNKS